MGKCNNCGFDNSDDMKFCVNCGTEIGQNAVCGNCGAPLKDDVKFCGNCGAAVAPAYAPAPIVQAEQPVADTARSDSAPVAQKCTTCGAELVSDSAFCCICGTPVSKMRRASGGKSTGTNEKLAAVKSKVKGFEKKHGIIINGIIAALSLVFILVSLLGPIKMTSGAPIAGSNGQTETYEYSQSIWQVFDSLAYVSLDINDPDDVKMIENIFKEYEEAQAAALEDLENYAQANPYVSEEEALKKTREFLQDHLSEINYLAYQFAYTTIGALDYMTGAEVEEGKNDELNTQRNTAVLTLIMALVTSAIQIGIAAISSVFLILAIIGIVRKKSSKLFAFLGVALALSCIGLAVLSISPQLSASGAMFAVALTSALSYFVCAIGKAVMTDKKVAFTVIRTVHAALAVTACFMLCSNVITVSLLRGAGNNMGEIFGPLGLAFENIFVVLQLLSSDGVYIVYSDLSLVTPIIVLALGLLAFVILFVAMFKSLRALAHNTERVVKFDVLMLLGAILLICFAIAPAILGAADRAPMVNSNEVAVRIKITARIFVYLSMAFAIAAFVFGLVLNPKKLAAATGSNAPQTSATAQLPIVNSASSENSQGETAGASSAAEPADSFDAAPVAQGETLAEKDPEQCYANDNAAEQQADAEVNAEAETAQPTETQTNAEAETAQQTAPSSKKPAAKKPLASKSTASKTASKKKAASSAAEQADSEQAE